MFKQSLKLCKHFPKKSTNVLSTSLRFSSSEVEQQTDANVKWDLYSAICVERHPVITLPMNDLEKRMLEMHNQIAFEKSMKSDHELRQEADEMKQALIKAGDKRVALLDDDEVTVQTAQDFVDAGVEELQQFKFASRTTEADAKNIKTSLERKLDQNLLLLIESKVGKDSVWIPPEGIVEEGETLRETAERVLKTSCGDKIKAQIYGNAPVGCYKYTYEGDEDKGAKIFYFLAKYVEGNVADNVKHQWLDRTEIQETIPEAIYKKVSKFLLPQ